MWSEQQDWGLPSDGGSRVLVPMGGYDRLVWIVLWVAGTQRPGRGSWSAIGSTGWESFPWGDMAYRTGTTGQVPEMLWDRQCAGST